MKPYRVEVHIKLLRGDDWPNDPLANIARAESVPINKDPIEHLRGVVNRAFDDVVNVSNLRIDAEKLERCALLEGPADE